MATTPRGYPYPVNADSPNAPAQFLALATAIDSDVATFAKVRTIYKTSATARSSLIVPADDPDLQITVPAGVWLVDSMVAFTGGTATDDVSVYLKYSGTFSMGTMLATGPARAGTDNSNNGSRNVYASGGGAAAWGMDGATQAIITMSAIFNCSTGGIFTVPWSQVLSSATALNLREGSWLRATQVI